MPNWCENWLSIRSAGQPVQDYIDGWRAASQDPGLAFSLTSFVPMPGGIWHYDWCVANWGTHLDTDSAEIEILDDRLERANDKRQADEDQGDGDADAAERQLDAVGLDQASNPSRRSA